MKLKMLSMLMVLGLFFATGPNVNAVEETKTTPAQEHNLQLKNEAESKKAALIDIKSLLTAICAKLAGSPIGACNRFCADPANADLSGLRCCLTSLKSYNILPGAANTAASALCNVCGKYSCILDTVKNACGS